MFVAIGMALLWAGFFWTFYVALEPYVRRRWPQSMIAWGRPLGGVAFGVGVGAYFLGRNLILETYVSGAGRLELDSFAAARQAVGEMLFQVILRTGFALVLFFLFFPLRALLRSQWIAAASFTVLLIPLTPGSAGHPALAVVLNTVGPVIILFVTIRFGVLAMTASFFTTAMLIQFPATTDLSAWYAGSTLFVYAVVLALAGYGRSLFKGEFLDAD